MARYTGPKTKIARKFGEPIFGDDKSLKKEIILQDSMEIIKEDQKIRVCYPVNGKAKSKIYLWYS